ncbi:glycoside hydrolase family 65 protein [Indiicoccus explosivorum]|uniref:glycoside hydrolase family 65 protein n=1 Tax=Indiicoccus explosivorum TaxID=1917864 RepID=UPI000B44195E|nr:glycoside hydrolase family 65 protein [Indiicoccus explosivorum]
MTRERILREQHFDLNFIKKYESLMAQGNGYLGLRASHEEAYTEQTRGMYTAGIYNRPMEGESADLVNFPDVAGFRIKIDGTLFSLLAGEVRSYERELDLSTGELRREILWRKSDGAEFRFLFRRFVSKDDLHLVASEVRVTSLDREARIEVVTGIDAQQTNHGSQHLIEKEVRVLDEDVMLGTYRTSQSGHTAALAATVAGSAAGKESFAAKNRQLVMSVKVEAAAGEPYVFEKKAVVYTSLDRDLDGRTPEAACLDALAGYAGKDYGTLLRNSAAKWTAFWRDKEVLISSADPFDQLALDFALYHLEIMTPAHDERFGVGAKGLTGEGYKGHVFWDAEMFILPFHLLTEPRKARQLLRYRYLKLEQAQEKAARNGYEGALFPWESALTGEEETPEFAAINIRTGDRQRISSAVAEHHIVADIAFATVQYYLHTGDEEFMKTEGLALLMETGRFWMSRASERDGRLVLEDVIGPDEYTEHVDNNAFTNYMARYNVEQALRYMEQFGAEDEAYRDRAEAFLERLYLPVPDAAGLIPQDDTFLSLPEIDLSAYKENQGSQGILLDYSRQEVNRMQILKQADVVMLLYLFPDQFPLEVIAENLAYYEARTIHDSSLSKAVHAIVAARCGEEELAYRFFREACLIDLGPKPDSSDEGIHGASLGALWLATVFGFANVSFEGDCIRLDPKLPKEWSELTFPLRYRGRHLEISISRSRIRIIRHSGPELHVKVSGSEAEWNGRTEISIDLFRKKAE